MKDLFEDVGGWKVLLVILAVALLVFKYAMNINDDLLTTVIIILFTASGVWQAGTVVKSRAKRKVIEQIGEEIKEVKGGDDVPPAK